MVEQIPNQALNPLHIVTTQYFDVELWLYFDVLTIRDVMAIGLIPSTRTFLHDIIVLIPFQVIPTIV